MKKKARKIEESFSQIGNSITSTKDKIVKMKEVQANILPKIEQAKQLQTEMLEMSLNANFF